MTSSSVSLGPSQDVDAELQKDVRADATLLRGQGSLMLLNGAKIAAFTQASFTR